MENSFILGRRKPRSKYTESEVLELGKMFDEAMVDANRYYYVTGVAWYSGIVNANNNIYTTATSTTYPNTVITTVSTSNNIPACTTAPITTIYNSINPTDFYLYGCEMFLKDSMTVLSPDKSLRKMIKQGAYNKEVGTAMVDYIFKRKFEDLPLGINEEYGLTCVICNWRLKIGK